MKTKYLLPTSIAALALFSTSQLYAADYYTDVNGGMTTSNSWQNTTTWLVDGSAPAAVPARNLLGTDNIKVEIKGANGAFLFGGAFVNLTNGHNGYRINNFDIEFAAAGHHMLSMQQYTGNFELQIMGDMSISGATAANRYEMVGMFTRGGYAGDKNTLSILGDVTLSSLSNYNVAANSNITANSFLIGHNVSGNSKVLNANSFYKQVRIGGDVNLTNKSIGFATEGGNNVDIGGRVVFNDQKSFLLGNLGSSAEDAATHANQNINVGGLHSTATGAGVIRNAVDSQGSAVIRIQALNTSSVASDFSDFAVTATNFGGTYTGAIDGNISIVMNYAGQTQKITGANTYTGDTVVNAGRLITSGNANSDVHVNGGSFGVNGSGAIKSLSINSGGKLFFDLSNSGYLIDADTINIEGGETALLDFLSFSDIQEGVTYTLIAMDFDELDGLKRIYQDEATGLYYEGLFSSDTDSLSVVFTAVPEPAAYAVLFGAIALAFAAYRRRK